MHDLSIRYDRPEYITHRHRFLRDKKLSFFDKCFRKDGFFHLKKWVYNKLLRKYDCWWLHKFMTNRQEIGRIAFSHDGIEYTGTYAFWAKDWNVHMTKPIDTYLGRHLMYMIPTTYWSAKHFDVYGIMKNEMISTYKAFNNSTLKA